MCVFGTPTHAFTKKKPRRFMPSRIWFSSRTKLENRTQFYIRRDQLEDIATHMSETLGKHVTFASGAHCGVDIHDCPMKRTILLWPFTIAENDAHTSDLPHRKIECHTIIRRDGTPITEDEFKAFAIAVSKYVVVPKCWHARVAFSRMLQ